MADFAIKRGDQLPAFIATLYDVTGTAVDLTEATTAKLALRLVGAVDPVIYSEMTIDNQEVSPGQVTYEWQAGDTDAAGDYQAEIVVSWGGNEQTFPTIGYLTLQVVDDLETHVEAISGGFKAFSAQRPLRAAGGN